MASPATACFGLGVLSLNVFDNLSRVSPITLERPRRINLVMEF